ncbi:MAG TPA: DUF1801 domain-containing protein [Steroidobacteraceae bacterium]|nr:DUF1801 domain-containing protein [Steroidobacteraceae bacterium]
MNQRRGRSRIPLDLHGMSGRTEIFRISGAVKRDAAIDRWLTEDPIELRSIARQWFARMRECGDAVREVMHDGCPVACVEDAPFAYVNSFRSHVNVGFFYGAALEDPAHLLEGSGKRMRHVKVSPGGPLNAVALGELISSAYADIRARLDAERCEGPVRPS